MAGWHRIGCVTAMLTLAGPALAQSSAVNDYTYREPLSPADLREEAAALVDAIKFDEGPQN